MRAQFVRLQLVKHAISEKIPLDVILEKTEPLVQYVLNGTSEYKKNADECDSKYAEALLQMIQQRFGKESASSVDFNEHAFVMNVSDAFKHLIEWELKGPQAPEWVRCRRVELKVTPPK